MPVTSLLATGSGHAALDQVLAAATGGLLLTAVLLLWRRSISGAVTLLALQGGCLAALALVIAADEHDAELLVSGLLLAAVKMLAIPLLIRGASARVGSDQETAPLVNPTTGMLLAAVLTTVAYLVARPIQAGDPTGLGRAVPIGLAVVLIGFLILATRRQALGQIVGFVTVDNGISATGLLTAGGVPLLVEAGVVVDVLLVVTILVILALRIRATFDGTDLRELAELRD
jgi:hydrogenase-4 component E